jgi:hypothetical protein
MLAKASSNLDYLPTDHVIQTLRLAEEVTPFQNTKKSGRTKLLSFVLMEPDCKTDYLIKGKRQVTGRNFRVELHDSKNCGRLKYGHDSGGNRNQENLAAIQ